MKVQYFLEGHKAKTTYQPEDTLILDDEKAYGTEKEATDKAKECLQKNKDLSMMIIYKKTEGEEREAARFIHRNKEGELEEIVNWW
ncbi:hypothetical protein KGY73_05835 [bacterium]|nr:hypothetical protein [bacterium]